MEKLFFKFLTHLNGDFEDSHVYESVEPILYSSQKDAIQDFTLILKEYESYLQNYLKTSQELCIIRDTLGRQLISSNEKNTPKNDPNLLELQKKHKEAFNNCAEHIREKSSQQLNLIDFGGYDLDLDVFFTPGFHSNPVILTINEYFEDVEKKMSRKKTNSYTKTK